MNVCVIMQTIVLLKQKYLYIKYTTLPKKKKKKQKKTKKKHTEP